ncbi:hypothetical protein VCSRO37_1333 [Vibrio cholerae]|nr:hypothetical protein VCSRO37_1333 [Vibrio cholerae]
MIKRRIPALLLALSPLWVSASVYAEEVTQADPVAAIDEKLSNKQNEINAILTDYEVESGKLQQLKNEQSRLKREGEELDAKRNRAKSELDKQYTRLLEDPDTDLVTFQKRYQEAWNALKSNQSQKLDNEQAVTEIEMRLSQIKQRQARLDTELTNLEEAKIEARVKRLAAELRESSVLETTFKTTCSTTMTLGECANQGQYLTKQKAVKTFRENLINDSVTINGVNYGSTPVELVLPAGKHQVTVSKEGYETYNRVITVNGNDTVWVKLRPNKDS